jgi:hypothetical protein
VGTGFRKRSCFNSELERDDDLKKSYPALERIKENYQMATTRRETKTITLTPEPEEPVQDLVTQRKRPDSGRFRLQVDRQTKESYTTYEAAEAAGLAIKKDYPILQVAVYDGVDRLNKIIELPKVANPLRTN